MLLSIQDNVNCRLLRLEDTENTYETPGRALLDTERKKKTNRQFFDVLTIKSLHKQKQKKKQEETPIDLVKFHCFQAFDFEYGSSI